MTAVHNLATGNLLLYPNPAAGVVTLRLPGGMAPARVELHSASGALLGIMSEEETEKSFDVPRGMLLITLVQEGQQHTLRLVSERSNLRLRIGHALGDGNTRKSALIENDDYTINYEDPTGNLEGRTWNETIPVGTTTTIDEELEWTNKETYWTARTNTNTKITATNNEEALDETTTNNGKTNV